MNLLLLVGAPGNEFFGDPPILELRSQSAPNVRTTEHKLYGIAMSYATSNYEHFPDFNPDKKNADTYIEDYKAHL